MTGPGKRLGGVVTDFGGGGRAWLVGTDDAGAERRRNLVTLLFRFEFFFFKYKLSPV